MTFETTYLKLFPLSMVLFPGINIPLHIFEERYKLMVNECLAQDEPFGIVLVREENDSSGRTQPYSVGTSAWINDVERLSGGRMNIMVQGGRRFRVLEYRTDQPYLTALVEFLDPQVPPDLSQSLVAHVVEELFRQYVDHLVRIAGHRLHKLELPEDPETLGAMVGSLLAVPIEERQQLLEETDLESLRGARRISCASRFRGWMRRVQTLRSSFMQPRPFHWSRKNTVRCRPSTNSAPVVC